MKSIFQHVKAPVPADCEFKISPSSIGAFFDYPSSWYREHILGESGFIGNTSSIIGTAVHYMAEQYALGKKPTKQFMEAQIDAIKNSDVNKEEVKAIFPELAQLLVNDHVVQRIPDLVEHSVCAQILPGIYVAGTIDVIKIQNKGTKHETYQIEDYKTAATKPNTASMPFGYKIQQLSYAYALKKQGIKVDKISLIYVTRPTKTLPARLFPVHHIITDDDWKLVEDTLTLVAESVKMVKDYPELTHLIFKSMSLKAD